MTYQAVAAASAAITVLGVLPVSAGQEITKETCAADLNSRTTPCSCPGGASTCDFTCPNLEVLTCNDGQTVAGACVDQCPPLNITGTASDPRWSLAVLMPDLIVPSDYAVHQQE